MALLKELTLEQLQANLEDAKARLENPDLTPEDRLLIEDEIKALEAEIEKRVNVAGTAAREAAGLPAAQ